MARAAFTWVGVSETRPEEPAMPFAALAAATTPTATSDWAWPPSGGPATSTSTATGTSPPTATPTPCAPAPTNCWTRPTPGRPVRRHGPLLRPRRRVPSGVAERPARLHRPRRRLQMGLHLHRRLEHGRRAHEVKDHSLAAFERQYAETGNSSATGSACTRSTPSPRTARRSPTRNCSTASPPWPPTASPSASPPAPRQGDAIRAALAVTVDGEPLFVRCRPPTTPWRPRRRPPSPRPTTPGSP